MRWSERRGRFRSILTGTTCVYPGSVHDPISARIAQDVGFEIGMFAGSVASLTVLGAPDHILITLSEFADQAHRICRAADLPLMVDADHGYGNALNVMRTVEELERAGVSGLSIEDTCLPAVHGAPRKSTLLSRAEGAGKMRAAVRARRDPGLVIAGRTSAPGMTGIDDAIERAKAYEGEGVDMIFLIGVKTLADLGKIAKAIKLPLMLGGAGAEIMDKELLAAHGVHICLQGHQPFAASVQALYTTMKALRDGTPPAKLANIAGKEMMARYTCEADYDNWIDEFLAGSA